MQLTPDGPQWNERAYKVARERFPEISDFDSYYYVASLLSKKSKRRSMIKAQCNALDRKWVEQGYMGRYYKVTKCGLVFVVAVPETIIHVFRLIGTAKSSRYLD